MLALNAMYPPEDDLKEQNFARHPDREVYERLLALNERLTGNLFQMQTLPEIDADQLRADLAIVKRNQKTPELERGIPLWSSDPTMWYPTRVVTLIEWIYGGTRKYMHPHSLGLILARFGRQDLLAILAESGDEKARFTMDRHRLPKALHGKDLQYAQLDETTWLVTVSEPDRRSFYERRVEWFFDIDDEISI
jgi:hypothetical protein